MLVLLAIVTSRSDHFTSPLWKEKNAEKKTRMEKAMESGRAQGARWTCEGESGVDAACLRSDEWLGAGRVSLGPAAGEIWGGCQGCGSLRHAGPENSLQSNIYLQPQCWHWKAFVRLSVPLMEPIPFPVAGNRWGGHSGLASNLANAILDVLTSSSSLTQMPNTRCLPVLPSGKMLFSIVAIFRNAGELLSYP